MLWYHKSHNFSHLVKVETEATNIQPVYILDTYYILCDAVPISTGNGGLTWRGVSERGGGRSEVGLRLIHTGIRETLRQF